MAEATPDLIYEVLKSMQTRLDRVDDGLADVKGELQAIRGHLNAMGQDIANIYHVAGRHDDRLERIETRLGLLDPAH